MYDYDEDKYILKSFYVSIFGLLHQMQNKSESVDKQCTNYENSPFHSFPILEFIVS